jgi:hypothetical protein
MQIPDFASRHGRRPHVHGIRTDSTTTASVASRPGRVSDLALKRDAVGRQQLFADPDDKRFERGRSIAPEIGEPHLVSLAGADRTGDAIVASRYQQIRVKEDVPAVIVAAVCGGNAEAANTPSLD